MELIWFMRAGSTSEFWRNTRNVKCNSKYKALTFAVSMSGHPNVKHKYQTPHVKHQFFVMKVAIGKTINRLVFIAKEVCKVKKLILSSS